MYNIFEIKLDERLDHELVVVHLIDKVSIGRVGDDGVLHLLPRGNLSRKVSQELAIAALERVKAFAHAECEK